MPAPVPRLSMPLPRLALAIGAMSLVGAQLFHEAGHCLVSLLYGRGPTWGTSSLVQLSDRAPRDPVGWVQLAGDDGSVSWLRLVSLPTSDAEWILFFAAGPLFGLLALAVGLLLSYRASRDRARTIGLLLALVNAIGMTAYYARAALGGVGSDEANLADYLGLPGPVVAAALAVPALAGLVLVFRALADRRERIRIGLLGLVVIVVEGPFIMLANILVRDQVDAANPLFGPVLGFSLPVLVLAIVATGLAWWASGTPARRAPAAAAALT